jgi:hypothetical protein
MSEEIKEQIKVVVEARQAAAVAAENFKQAKVAFEVEHCAVIDLATSTAKARLEAEDKLRELILEAFALTGEKAPVPGVGVRVNQILVYDPKLAFDWAKAHKVALLLDKKAFEKMAKAGDELRPSFVEIIDVPTATIAEELELVV